MNDYILNDLQRRLTNLIRRGRVHSVDFSKMPPRVKVEYSQGAVTAWLPFVSLSAGLSCTTWNPLSIGEQVIILAESGDLNCGIVVPAIHCADNPPPSVDPNAHMIKFSDGTQVDYNRENNKLIISCVGDVEITAKSLIINAEIKHTGNQSTSGNISAGGDISDKTRSMSEDREIYNGHTHPTPHGTSQKPNQQQ